MILKGYRQRMQKFGPKAGAVTENIHNGEHHYLSSYSNIVRVTKMRRATYSIHRGEGGNSWNLSVQILITSTFVGNDKTDVETGYYM
jgi:hypothetical protein